jgi:S-adenosylmethionine hydrolase
MSAIITLLTDFGTADGYVGEVKGVLLSRTRNATVVDISHEIPAHDIEMGRLALARYWRRYPQGTIHMVVVDPGVGTERAGLAVSSDGFFLVGPDNGVLSPALLMPSARAISLSIPPGSSTTFHGRDVFAPAVAHLANSSGLDSLGQTFTDPVIRRTPEPHRLPNGDVQGEVIAIDRFGNAITNLLGAHAGTLVLQKKTLRLHRTYGDLGDGEVAAVVGSSGLIEIVQRGGRASDALRLERGARVVLQIER